MHQHSLLADPVLFRETLSSVKAEISQESPSACFFPKEGSHVRIVSFVPAARPRPTPRNHRRPARTGHPHRPAPALLSPGRVVGLAGGESEADDAAGGFAAEDRHPP